LINTTDNESPSRVPRLKDNVNAKNPAVTKINEALLERFEINTYNQAELKDFNWIDLHFDHEIKRNILFIYFAGDYYGAYENFVEEEVFFDLTTGDELKNTDIPFHALMSLKGYFAFMNKHWLPAVKPLFKEATECAGEVESFCSYYDINRYEYSTDQTFTCSLSSDCYPHAMLACAPIYTLTIPGDSLQPYLSNFGKDLFTTNHYSQLKGIEKYVFNKKIESQIPANVFIIGKIDGKYEFSLAIQVNQQTHKADGYYYYEKKKVPINLTGIAAATTIQLNESSNGKVTGKMLFILSDSHQEKGFMLYDIASRKSTYVTGTWSSPDGKTKMDIAFTEIMTTYPLR
jgi:hypothetical protein